MRRTTASALMCFGSGICTRMPWTAESPLSRSTIAISSSCEIVAGLRIVSPCIPSSMHVRSLDPTYTALAGSSPTSTTESPGVTPRALSASTRAATSDLIRPASAAPSINVPAAASVESARKVHRPCLANEHDFDLHPVLQLRFDASRDFFRHRRHPHVVHVVRQYDHAHLSACLDGEHLFHSLVARRDLLEAFQPLDVRLERLAARAGTRAGHGVGRLDEH